MWNTDPDTGAGWTRASINAAELGLKAVARMANDLSASKLVGYALEKASGKDSIDSGKLAAYSVLSPGVVLTWPPGYTELRS